MEIWDEVRDDLRQLMTPENFNQWFAPTVARGLIDGELCVQVPDSLHLGWLDQRLRPRVHEALARLEYTDVRVTFMLSA